MIDHQELAQKFKAARETAELTQAELAKRADLSLFTLAKLEQGKVSQPSFFTVLALTEQLGISIDELTGFAAKTADTAPQAQWSNVSWCFVDATMLFSGWFESIGLLAEQLAVDSLKLEHLFLANHRALLSGQLSVFEFEQLISEQFDAPARKIDLRSIWFEQLRIPSDLLQQLRELYAQGVTIGVIGLVSKQLLDDLAAHDNLPDFLANEDNWVLVDSTADEAELFEIAERTADQLPKQLLFLSDNHGLVTLADSRNWQTSLTINRDA